MMSVPALPPVPPEAPPTLSHALADKLRELLKDRGWSQRQLADRLKVSQGAVSYLLGNKRRCGSFNYYERLAEVFEMRLSQLCQELEARIGVDSILASRPLSSRPEDAPVPKSVPTATAAEVVRGASAYARPVVAQPVVDVDSVPGSEATAIKALQFVVSEYQTLLAYYRQTLGLPPSPFTGPGGPPVESGDRPKPATAAPRPRKSARRPRRG